MKKNKLFICHLFISSLIFSQTNLLDKLENESDSKLQNDISSFKAIKIVNNQSTKQANLKELYLYVSHRFGSVDEGINTLFGLDIANTKIELLYGLSNNFQIGFSRESLKKTYALNAKYNITNQSSKLPLNSSLYLSYNYNSSLNEDIYPNLSNSDRSLFLSQLLLSKSFSNKISLQLSPSFARKGFTETIFEQENNFILGLASSYRINNRLAFNVEYSSNLDRPEISPFNDVLSFGIDIETGGHVFQLLFSNTQTIDDVSVMTDAEGSWKDGKIYFGFNILRVF